MPIIKNLKNLKSLKSLKKYYPTLFYFLANVGLQASSTEIPDKRKN
jgi:hypothetical protein